MAKRRKRKKQAIPWNNFVFGWFWILVANILALYLYYKLYYLGDVGWAGTQLKSFWKATHLHANLLGFLNILFYFSYEKFRASEKQKVFAGNMLLWGSFVFTLGLFLIPFARLFVSISMLGGVMLVFGLVVLAYDVLLKRK